MPAVPRVASPSARERIAPHLRTLTERADFLRAARALRSGQSGFLLQARQRDDGSDAIRIGFTCSRKIGNSVIRNRAKRRLREIARTTLPEFGRAGWDYVLVGRPDATIRRDFSTLKHDLQAALVKVHSR